VARTARSLHARKKRKKVLDQAKGYRGTKKSSYKRAKEQVWKGGVYAYAHRKQRKRNFRALWIQRINAGAREHGLSYSQFVHGLRLAEIDLDRKVLADLAATEPDAFAMIVSQAQNALDGNPVQRRVEGDGSGNTESETTRTATSESGTSQTSRGAQSGSAADEVEATEAAERKAEELDVDLSEVEGTGSEGQVVVEDVEDASGEEKATDAARRNAEKLGVDLADVEGTGSGGRITVGDVENAAKKEDVEAG
jgi:large subunit ribosomal protein L20